MKKIEKSMQLGGKTLKITKGTVAAQATSAVLVQYGDTVVLVTVVSQPMKIDLGYFPLSVEYQERLYAGGKIKGSRWVKREGRPTDEEILNGRLIDRGIRPLFPKEYKKDVQLTAMVMSVDMENSPDIAAAIGASCVLSASEIPWNGPLATMRVGRVDGKLVANPTLSEIETSDLDLVVSSTKDAILMIESGANQIDEKEMLSALKFAFDENQKLISFINDFVKESGVEKEKIEKSEKDIDFISQVKKLTSKDLPQMAEKLAKKEASYADLDEYKAGVADNFEGDDAKGKAKALVEELLQNEIRSSILSGKRPDGRKTDELRSLSAEVEVIPRVHGSAIFQRGQTQVMSITTLGAPSLGQLIETAEGEEEKRYMHHYSMPPYSSGEVGRMGSPSRREIGHGALAERAIMPVLPTEEEFPYAIRVVSEVLSSNGSTSMASTCGSTLSLMDAGVPIKSPVAGIAMGLIVEDEKKFVVLTDITGLEDGNGDMDFKVAGTKDGITALQLDVKTPKLTLSILEKALEQAKKARMDIMAVMLKALPAPREKVSTHAPKIKTLKVPVEKIGEVIGPGGKTIKAIIAETGAQVDIEDDGTVNISGIKDDEVEAAIKKVELLTKEVIAGEIYEGEVKRIESFGAFVGILPGRDGMVHVSDMSMDFVKDPNDIVKIGQVIKVRVKEIDNMGRINLSMLLDGDKPRGDKNGSGGGRPPQRGRGDRRSGDRRNGGRFDRNRGRRDSRGRSQGQRSSGPHFPTSRYIDEK